SVQKACLSVKSAATVVTARLVAIVAHAVTVVIAATVVSVVTVLLVLSSHPLNSRVSKTTVTLVRSNSSHERREETGCWQLEDARQPCIQHRADSGSSGGRSGRHRAPG